MEKTNCENCGTQFKIGLISSINPLSKKEVSLINEYIVKENPKSGYCTKCGDTFLKNAKEESLSEIKKLKKFIETHLNLIVVMSIAPTNNQYKIIDLVTAQNVTGTGVLSELSSDFNDLFGTRSNTLSAKLKKGEDFCKTQLRLQALNLGCHAIVGVDIDYSEMGSLRGMMMVCMSGTAIRYESIDIYSEELNKLIETNKRLNYLTDLIEV